MTVKRPESSENISPAEAPEIKKLRVVQDVKGPSEESVEASSDPVETLFSEGLFSQSTRENLKKSIEESGPYKHGVIHGLLNDSLLRNVRKEIEAQLHFTKKETDIYKVFQTGDLANLSGLEEQELQKLSSLFELRRALYSKEFREYLAYVSGSGPLSGVKQDLSINCYQKGCHLLNHDDVIGSRRISYILYLPDPDEVWDPKWGGALRLFPTICPNVPAPDYTLVLPPAWNQLAFFTVQPGLSFHDVEEVFVDKPRLSISGWFHIPQPGEPGFIEGEQEATEARSSLQQLESHEMQEFDLPKVNLTSYEPRLEKDLGLPVEELEKYLNPALINVRSVAQLNERFAEDSIIEIHSFLNPEYASLLRQAIDKDDMSEIPKTSLDVKTPWNLARPPHKFQYMYLEDDINAEDVASSTDAEQKLFDLKQFLNGPAFGQWLQKISGCVLLSRQILARRFRPGQDFTLATTHSSEEPVLEATLSLTPTKGWEDGEIGGYDLCMMAEESSSNDPAVYQGASKEDEDAVLMTAQADWNVLRLILRDKGILRFVKYVSKLAPGSRWDIAGQWQIDSEEEEDMWIAGA